jgi:ABC-2 type transport system permease protein
MSAPQQSAVLDPAAAGIRTAGTARRPGLLALGLARIGLELKTFSRNREAVIFTFAFPVMILVLFGSIFSGELGDTGVDFRQYMVAGIMASGVMSVSFQTLAFSIALEQDDGTLKRLAGTPMPKAAYFVGKMGMVLVVGLAEVAVTLGVGTLGYGMELPATAARWLTLAWVFGLGITACALIGIAYSRVIRNAKAAAAVVTPPFIFLQFVSGVYVVYTQLPEWLQRIGALFPLKWMAQGLRSVFLPDGFMLAEPAQSWEHGMTALVLAAWLVAAFAASVLVFRWRGRGDAR